MRSARAPGKGSNSICSVSRVLSGDHGVCNSLTHVWSSSVREQDFVDLEQSLLIVYEELKHISLVSGRKVIDLNLVLGHLSQFEQTRLEVFGFLGALVDTLQLLGVQNLSLETPLHDVLASLLYTFDEKILKVVLLLDLTDFYVVLLFGKLVLQLSRSLHILNCCDVVSLKELNELNDLILNILRMHTRIENEGNELLKLNILGWDVPQFRDSIWFDASLAHEQALVFGLITGFIEQRVGVNARHT